jgi:valyl-tRNA synthetase
MPPTVPEKPALEGLEAKWRARWEEEGTYRFDRTKGRDEIYSIDTPPPTVSGELHIGHACSYTHTDLLARYQRMRGREVFYPMGWDDNGLNVERRVQLMRGIACDPSLPYDPDFEAPEKPPKDPVHISRPNFMEQCAVVVDMLEQKYFDLWSTLGLSVDWTQTYTTIGEKARRTSQRGFLRLLARDLAYRAEAPTLWDVDMKTAVAQAELADRELPGAYHKLAFHNDDGDVLIETTRPELLAACVALVAHPDDARYQPLFGTEVTTPLYGVRVPVVAHELADPEKGSGIAMICTFGDTTDVVWWRELSLPVRAIVQRDGRLRPVTFGEPGWEAADIAQAQARYDEIAGRTVKQAQKRVVEQLVESGEMVGEPKPITHAVKFWENGNRPLEIVTNRQWFIRYPPKDEMQARGRELAWFPEFMRVRYENWVEGLVGDWNITRQRFFGVPFPIWYPIDADGEVRHDQPITADEASLPVDPSTDVPPGYTADQRDQPGGFAADPDVMDTWATSSLTPQIVCGWIDDDDLFARTFPMDMRPQAHEIIRTWLFSTIVRSHYEHGSLPWHNGVISGFVMDPDRKKFSKSAGNAQETPGEVIDEFGADAVRYWAAGGKLGMDVAFDRNRFKIGRRLAIKILNASRFALTQIGDAGADGEVTEPLDRAMLAQLADVVDAATAAFEGNDWSRALERVEPFFWSFCDDYLELVKSRAYGTTGDAGAASARAALAAALSVQLRLFAPFLAFVTEEVWSWWQPGSIHRAPWPDASEVRARAGGANGTGDGTVLEVAAEVLRQVRKAKTDAKRSMKAPVQRVTVTGPDAALAGIRAAESDLRDAGGIQDLELQAGAELTVAVELAENPA